MPLGSIFKIKLRVDRYANIDGMRAVAALLVVSSHYSRNVLIMFGETTGPSLVTAMGDIGVQIFFCITGFLFTRKALAGPIDVPQFISSRVRRIAPLYLVCMTLGLMLASYTALQLNYHQSFHLLDVLSAYGSGFLGDPIGKFSGVPLASIIGQVWTLHWEWLFYLCVPFLAAILARPKWLAMLALFVILCSIYREKLVTQQIWMFFIPGAVTALFAERVRIGTAWQVLLLVLGILTFGISIFSNLASHGSEEFVLCVVGFPALVFGHKAMLSTKPLRILGEVSYSIYLIHLFLPAVFWIIVMHVAPLDFASPLSRLHLAILMAPWLFPICFLSYALIERPFMANRQKEVARPFFTPDSTGQRSSFRQIHTPDQPVSRLAED